jgi:hypothetical protein
MKIINILSVKQKEVKQKEEHFTKRNHKTNQRQDIRTIK